MKYLTLICCLFSLTAKATNYYADPLAGSMANTGSFNSPWASLSSIFTANKTFAAGDTLFLRTGNHGYALIRGLNTGYVVIAPQPGQMPIIDRIRISASPTLAADYWKLYGLTIQSESTGTTATPAYFLLEIYPYATHITVSHCTISSNLNTTGWTRDDWRNRCNNGLSTRGKLNANYIIEDNIIKNVAFGLSISSSSTIVRGNTVQYFTNDGSRVVGSDILFEKNRVLDLIKVMSNLENHDDLFQSFVYPAGGTGQDTLKNNVIRNNLFVCCTDTTRAFRGPVQGIGCFDGVYLNWVIENNIVMPDHWHGISLYGAVNCRIVNNTVLDPYPYTPVDPVDNNATNIGPAWITINKKTSGPPSSGNVVRNNLVANTILFSTPDVGVASNNLILGALANFSNYFVDVSNFAQPLQLDLHLRPGSPAIDAGETVFASTSDFDDVSRPQGPGFDIGAYEFLNNAVFVSETSARQVMRLYPNPSGGNIHVELPALPDAGTYTLHIYNHLGEHVFTEQVPAAANLYLGHLPKGLYMLSAQVEGGKMVVGRILLQ